MMAKDILLKRFEGLIVMDALAQIHLGKSAQSKTLKDIDQQTDLNAIA